MVRHTSGTCCGLEMELVAELLWSELLACLHRQLSNAGVPQFYSGSIAVAVLQIAGDMKCNTHRGVGCDC